MTSIENLIYQFIDTFYTDEERAYIKADTNIGFSINAFKKDFTDLNWQRTERQYKELLFYTDLNNFHLEVADRASYFIKKIFEKYVNDTTFVIHSSFEHPNVIKELNNVKHKKCLLYDQLITFNFDNFLLEFKESGCTKVFVYVPGTSTCTGQIVPQNFYSKIKQACNKYNIECMMMCDDVHGMFITPRDYSIFDFILYTCHSFIPNFDMGMLWSKREILGFTNIERAEAYYNKLKLFLSKSNKIRLFPILLAEYFSEDLSNTKYLDLYTNTTTHIFALKTKGLVFSQNYFDKCDEYNIRFGETQSFINFIRFRIQEFILEKPEFLLEGLALTKKALESFMKKAEIFHENIVFDGRNNIKHEIKENILIYD
jgi:hypothetical protein